MVLNTMEASAVIVKQSCFFFLPYQSCQVEIIPERTQAYLMFLAEHATDNGEEEFLATVIVSKST